MKSTNALFKSAGEALASSSPAAKKVTALCLEEEELLATIAGLEELLKSAKARHNELIINEIPEAMSQLGSSEWTSQNKHYNVKVDSFVSGTLPKEPEKRKKATDWVAKHGGEAIIKTEVSLAFGKQEGKDAERVIRSLTKAGFDPEVTTGIHHQTLLAFARERMANGEDVDFDTLGLFSGRKAVVKIAAEDTPKKATKIGGKK